MVSIHFNANYSFFDQSHKDKVDVLWIQNMGM